MIEPFLLITLNRIISKAIAGSFSLASIVQKMESFISDLLLTVVFIPFPASLIDEYISTDHAAPAVVLYNSVLSLQAIAWILICQAALKNHLGKNEKSTVKIRENGKFGYFAFILYSICAITAFWFPLSIAIFTTITWIFWLIYGVNIKYEEME